MPDVTGPAAVWAFGCAGIIMALIGVLNFFASYTEPGFPTIKTVILRNIVYSLIICTVIIIFAWCYAGIAQSLS